MSQPEPEECQRKPPQPLKIRYADECWLGPCSLCRPPPHRWVVVQKLCSLLLVIAAFVAIIINQMMPHKSVHHFDCGNLFDDLHDIPILNQDEALLELEVAFRHAGHNTAIILLGPPGVGKTMLVRFIERHCAKLRNVQVVNWDTVARYEADRYETLRRLLHEFRADEEDRVHLMIIDNLCTYNYAIVEDVRRMVAASESLSRRSIVFMYVFRLNPREPDAVYERQWESLQFVPYATTINFRPFTHKEIGDCIRQEARLNNIKLTRRAFEKILESIDVERGGCNDVKRLLWDMAGHRERYTNAKN